MPELTRVLVANRGEIAVRIVRAARDAGLETVSIYADEDVDARHVEMADVAYCLDGSTAAETYLNPRRIMAAARRSRADAIHPGYGFLSENADFAQLVVDEGLTWIGPPPAAIRELGDKITARRLAARAGAPMVPATEGPVESGDEVLDFARRFGYPVAIKASFGGGGRGLKVAHSAEEVLELLGSARREALAAFGNGQCYVERYLERARHVEVQVLVDQGGRVVVAGTRDCSLQRRFQKLVEEAPAPFLSSPTRDVLNRTASEICRLAGYIGAGTVEFLLGAQEEVSFLEVNTRLQVEHPVTEETTGLDLVREQFRIAAGLSLDHLPDVVEPQRHSLEFRVNCEDPYRQFLPSPGVITRYREPSGPGVRVDSGVTEGDVVTGRFDALVAKLIVTGRDRQEALQRAARALQEFQVEGVRTTLEFHRDVVAADAFTTEPSRVHTRWIETEWVPPICGTPPEDPDPAVTGATGPCSERHTAVIEVDGRRHVIRYPDGVFSERGVPPPATVEATRSKPTFHRVGAGAGIEDAPGGDLIRSPMHGTVVKVMVSPGDGVSPGDVVVVLEAMKMENPVRADVSGVIVNVRVAEGSSVAHHDVICELSA